jgi:hypothetical protein
VDGSGWWWIYTGEEEKVLVVFILELNAPQAPELISVCHISL